MNIGFIGAGNMGGALINGLLSSKKYSVIVYDKDINKSCAFKENGAEVAENIQQLSVVADIIILTVKPNVYQSVLKELNELNYSKKIISVSPGITVEYIKSQLPNAKIIRTMPNTPALVGEGMTLIAASDDINLQNEVAEIFKCVGKVSVISENLMDAGVALSGSSPAMIYRMIDIMSNSALSYGIPKKEAVKIAAQTVLGSAKMVLETGKHPIQLSDEVCSPGGTTIAAVNELENQGFDKAILKSMERCVEKSRSMNK